MTEKTAGPETPWRRRRPTGLRWRLVAWVAAVVIVSAGVIFVVVIRDTGSQLRAQVDRDLRSASDQLTQAMGLLAGRPGPEIAAGARRYVIAQPYSSTSTLLYVEVPGQGTVSNHPELFNLSAQPDDGESLSAQTGEDALTQQLLHVARGLSTREVTDIGQMRVLQRALALRTDRRPAAGNTILVGTAEPLAPVHRAQAGVIRASLLAAVVALVLALSASWLAGARISAPLRRMAAVAARVEGGDLTPRIAARQGPDDELKVLADAFDRMLDRLSAAFAAQREFVADASHELRTPLTVIGGQLEVLASDPDPGAPEVRRVGRLVNSELTRITRIVEDLSLLARSDRSDFVRPEPVALAPFVESLWASAHPLAGRRAVTLERLTDGTLSADPDRLAQAVRNLLGNAVEHTDPLAGRVTLRVDHPSPGRVRFVVSDNGPGVPPTEQERIFERFHRTDPARARATGGAGLGLSIVRAIAEAHAGTIRVVPSSTGARFELELPGFSPSPARDSAPQLGHRSPDQTLSQRLPHPPDGDERRHVEVGIQPDLKLDR